MHGILYLWSYTLSALSAWLFSWQPTYLQSEFGRIICSYVHARYTIQLKLLRRRGTVSGRLMINCCFAMMALYAQGICNGLVAASYNAVGCVVIAVLGQWMFLVLLFALAAHVLWVYLKLVRIFSAEPLYYSVKAIVVTWGTWEWFRSRATYCRYNTLLSVPHAVVPLLLTVISVAPNYRLYHRIHFFT